MLADRVYLFEFKLDVSAEKALAQIHNKAYSESYRGDSRNLYLVGVNFDSIARSVSEWKMEIVSSV